MAQQPTALVEGKRVIELRSAAVSILKSARRTLTFAVDAAWRFLASLPECSAKDGRRGPSRGSISEAARRLRVETTAWRRCLDRSEDEVRSSLNEAPSWASHAAVGALAFALRAAVVPVAGEGIDSRTATATDDGSDSEDDDETSDEAARRADVGLRRGARGSFDSTDAHDADVLKLEGEEPSKAAQEGRRRSSGDARLARCLLRGGRRVDGLSRPMRKSSSLLCQNWLDLGRALFGENGSSEDSSTVKPLVDQVSSPLGGCEGPRCGAQRDPRHGREEAVLDLSMLRSGRPRFLSQKPQTARVVSAVAAAARAVAVSARRQHLRSGTSQRESAGSTPPRRSGP